MEKQRTATRLLDRMLAALATGHREDAVADSDGFYANVYRGLVPGKLRSIMSGTPVMRRIYEQKARQALYDRPFFELTPQNKSEALADAGEPRPPDHVGGSTLRAAVSRSAWCSDRGLVDARSNGEQMVAHAAERDCTRDTPSLG